MPRRRPYRESPRDIRFVGYGPLSDYYDKAKRRHAWNKIKRQHAIDQINPPQKSQKPVPKSKPAYYRFFVRHYPTADHAVAGARMFAVWTMAQGDFLGIESKELFIQVTANPRDVYDEFAIALRYQFVTEGVVAPTRPPELDVLVKNGLDLGELLSKYPPLPDTPLKEL